MHHNLVHARRDQHSSNDASHDSYNDEKKDFKIRARQIGRFVYVHSQVN